MPRHSVWEIIFLMVILKIPIAYLCGVVYWAIKAEPRPPEGAAVTVQTSPDGDPGGRYRRRTRRRAPWLRPHGGPSRTAPRVPRTAYARASRR